MKKALIGLIYFYKKYLRVNRAPMCRFVPTCSDYAIEAISVHGAFKGSLMAIWRILRCNPFCKGGYDPVPPKTKKVAHTILESKENEFYH